MNLSDKDMMTDVLSSQKSITGSYNTFANEASGQNVKDTMMNILNEEHSLQYEVFLEMQKRGWYQTENAPQDKINETKTKFPRNCQTNC